jgi:hypothetical protein
VPFLHEAPLEIVRQVRSWRRLDRLAFREALLGIPAFADPSSLSDTSVADLFRTYEAPVTTLINALFPSHPAKMPRSALTPWLDAECRALQRRARRLERLYRRTKLPSDRTEWVRFVREMHRQHRDKERLYWEYKINHHSKEPRKLWATFNDLLGRSQTGSRSATLLFTAGDFLDAFTSKVRSVREATAGSSPPAFPPSECSLTVLRPVSSEELRRIILASPLKPATWTRFRRSSFKNSSTSSFLTVLCNRSLQEGILPTSQKKSILVLKREGLDSSYPANFRPIANGSFISKLMRKYLTFS